MNHADLIQAELCDRAFLLKEFGESMSETRLNTMSPAKIHALRTEFEYLDTCHDLMYDDDATPASRIMIRNVIIGLLKQHPDCEDLVEMIVRRPNP